MVGDGADLGPVDGPADTAEAIAGREGLDLAADLAAVRRRTARSAAPRLRAERAARRGGDRRSLECDRPPPPPGGVLCFRPMLPPPGTARTICG
ncbi:hypothetical protein AMK31_37430 [Streptomyces sp. TSRI0107]|nr:hypothetical protein AMK31_37430 [Streptomyces sp. TSRI0107]